MCQTRRPEMTLSPKNKLTKALTLSVVASFLASAALPVATAQAGHRGWNGDHRVHHVRKHKKHRKHYKKHRRNNNNAEALAAGLLGFAIGAIIVDQANRSQPRYVEPRRVYHPQPRQVYVQPQPRYEPYVERRPLNDVYDRPADYRNNDEPRVIRYEDEVAASYEPWTPGWAQWCDNKYRSFNANTGTFRGYDGRDHFCVVK